MIDIDKLKRAAETLDTRSDDALAKGKRATDPYDQGYYTGAMWMSAFASGLIKEVLRCADGRTSIS